MWGGQWRGNARRQKERTVTSAETATKVTIVFKKGHGLVAKNISVGKDCFRCSLYIPDKMHPNHLWQPPRSTTATLSLVGVVILFGG